MTTAINHTQARELRDQGIRALRGGDPALAQELLAQSVEINPQDEHAWLWLSGAADSDEDRRFCLERALAINPASAAARKGLERLGPAPVTGATLHLASAPQQISAPAPEPEPAAVSNPSTYHPQAPAAPPQQGRSEFEFPSWREWKSVWTGAVIVTSACLVGLVLVLMRLGILVSNDGSLHHRKDGLFKQLDGDPYLSRSSSKNFQADAGDIAVIEYNSTLRGGRPKLRLMMSTQYKLLHDMLVWQVDLVPGQQRIVVPFERDGNYAFEIHANGAQGEADLTWEFQ